jgi:hypothetical protein
MSRTFLRATALALALAACVPQALAMTYVMPSDEGLLANSDGVLVGTVVGEAVAAPKRGRVPHVRYTVAVERVVAGTLRRAEVKLDLPGTPRHAKIRAFIPGIPELGPGQRVLVFFEQQSGEVIVPRDLSLGLFMETRSSTGERAYLRKLDDAHAVNEAAARSGTRARHAARFEHWISRSAAGAQPVQDYFITDRAKFSLSPTGFPDALPARWFQFDTNQTINWFAVAGGMTGATFDEFAAVASALAAWTNDPTSRILFSYGGTVASDPGNDSNNGVNAVVWDDPGNDISGAYDCFNGGTLAFGGLFASSQTGVANGNTYHRAVEGFVLTQNGAQCVFNDNGGLDGIETLGHEVGHALGFGHSCTGGGCVPGPLNDALMRSFIHSDGRGAQLGADDIAGALFVYPDPSAGNPLRIFANGFE